MRRATAIVALTSLIGGGLAACSTGSTSAGSSSTTGTSGSGTAEARAFPVTIKHALGSTTIKQEPKRVVTVGWSDQDFAASLGVAPVAATKITWGGNAKGSTSWFDSAMSSLGNPSVTRFDDADGIPVDEIAKLQPDLILGTNSGMTSAEYAKLSKLAPTVAYSGKPWATPWRTSLDMVGKALGRSTKADEVESTTAKAITDGAAKYPQIKGKSAAWTYFTPTDLSTIGVYTSTDMRPQMLREFGMVDAPIVKKLSASSNTFSANLSAEKAGQVTADALLFYVDEKTTLGSIKGNALLKRIPPLASGHYVASADNAAASGMSSPTPLSIPVVAKDFLPKIASAVDGKPAS